MLVVLENEIAALKASLSELFSKLRMGSLGFRVQMFARCPEAIDPTLNMSVVQV